MIRFVPWSEVGTISVSPGDSVVEVGAFELAEGADTLWVRMTNTGTPGPWPWSYGVLSFKTDEGQPLGSVKAYNSFDGEVFRLGVGLPPSVRAGVLTFEPRGFNMAWIKQGNPWSLKFEAQSGTSGGQMTSYWNRDPVNAVLSPVTAGDSVDLGTGNLTASTGSFTDGSFSGNVLLQSGTSYAQVFAAGQYECFRAVTDSSAVLFRGKSNVGGASITKILLRADGAGHFGINSDGSENIRLNASGTGVFQGDLYAPNIQLRSIDPQYYRNGDYVGPELSLLEELHRLETLVKELYDKLRLAPPAGWEVWDGSDDLVTSLGTPSGH